MPRPSYPPIVRVHAITVFESVIYNCYVVDPPHRERPLLEVDAVLRPGGADEDHSSSRADVHGAGRGTSHCPAAPQGVVDPGRIVEHQGVAHIAFPTWEPVEG